MKKSFLFAVSVITLLTAKIACADCSPSLSLPNVPLNFYSHSIGTYTIFLTDTLTAIADGQADQNGFVAPYFEKSWAGSCPGGLDGSSCNEYTIYPDATNYSPGDIMKQIEKYNHGHANRGEVRIITDNSETNYVYTTDHEQTYCGPYPVPTGSDKEKN